MERLVSERECIDAGFCRPHHRANKDTTRWCRGKPGIPHRWLWTPETALPNAPGWLVRLKRRHITEVQFCSPCGKLGPARRSRCCICGVATMPGDYGTRRWPGQCPVCWSSLYYDWG